MIDFDCIAMILSSVISRLNLVGVCLPDEFQENIDDMKTDLINLLKEHKYDVNLAEVSDDYFLDMVSLYMELNAISRDLSTCLLLNSDENIEEAAFDINCIIKYMASKDSVFGCCYENAKRRVLK